jgi:hypothetical protein
VGTPEAELLVAVRAGNTAAVKALLAGGAPADAKYRYDRTALSFAADRGHLEIVKLLLDHGADPNARDTFYSMAPIGWAATHGHVEVAGLLLARGARDVGSVLLGAVEQKSVPMLEAALSTGRATPHDLAYTLEEAEKEGVPDVAARLRQAGAVSPPPADFKVPAAALEGYVGKYKTEDGKQEVTVSAAEGALQASFGGPAAALAAYDALRFKHTRASGVVLEFTMDGGKAVGVTVTRIGEKKAYARVAAAAEGAK